MTNSAPTFEVYKNGTGDIQELESTSDKETKKSYWHMFGRKFPKSEFVFFAQAILIYIVVGTALVNLSIGSNDSSNDKLWIALLSSSVGYLLPNPSLKDFTK